MAHYAFLDENNIVVDVIVGVDENEVLEGKDPETWYGEFRGLVCKRTSYNGNIRKNYASIGSTYDYDLDAFIPPQPFPSWVFDTTIYQWQAPENYPEDGLPYEWNEETLAWELIDLPEEPTE
jgi:hypothetical protein